MPKKLLLFFTSIFILVFALAGCQAKESTKKEDVVEKIVVDQNGRSVVIPEKIDRIAMTALPLPSIYALTGESIDKIVGMHPGSRSAIESSIMGVMYPELGNVSTGFVNGTDVNIEELLKLNPSLVFYWGAYTNQTAQLDESGIPSIGVQTQGEGDALLTLSSWLKLMGEIFGNEVEVKEVIDYGENTLNEIHEKVKGIEPNQKKKSLFLFMHSEEEIIVPGKGHYGDWWIKETGGNNVAEEINVTQNVNMEQIYKWNPEIIFITSFTATMPEDLYENNIEGQDWSGIDAVINKRVYKTPVGVYRWYPPSGDVPLMMKWMAVHQYPEIFDYDMKKEINDYYEKFYNFKLTEDQIDFIISPSTATAKGTGGLGIQK